MGLFDEQVARKPDLYPWTANFIQTMHEGFWTDAEFNFQSDISDFKTRLSDQERGVVVRTLSAIGQIEIAVKKFWAKLGDNLPHPSITDLGYVMANTEVIHNRAYERLLSMLGLNEVFEENLKNSIIAGRVDYLRKYLHRYYKDSKKQYIYSLILFTLFIENVSLFSQFYIVLWFGRYKNFLKDCNQQVSYTKNEENLHAQIGMKLVNVLRAEYPELFDEEMEELIRSRAQEAYTQEAKIIDWILEGYEGERLNADVLKSYIQQRLNESLKAIGYKKLFDVSKEHRRDFEWMDEELHGNNMTDFFHKRPTNYSKNCRTVNGNELF